MLTSPRVAMLALFTTVVGLSGSCATDGRVEPVVLAEPIESGWAVEGGEGRVTMLPMTAVSEMEPIAEADHWRRLDEWPPEAPRERIESLWNLAMPSVQARMSPRLFRELSRWAEGPMKAYDQTPSLESIEWKPRSVDQFGKRYVFAAIVNELPSHTPIVKRQIEMFLLYDAETNRLHRSIVTIRGVAHE